MTKRLGVLCALSLLVAGSAYGQIYKTVGPDGKVSYSDRPPISDEKASVTVLQRSGVTAPLPAPPSQAAPEPQAKSSAKRAINQAGAPATPASSAPASLPDDVISAVVSASGMQELIRQTREGCIAVLPTSFKRYSSSAEQWERRNAAVIEKKELLLNGPVLSARRALLEAGAADKSRTMLSAVFESRASTAVKIAWCDKSSAEMDGGGMDMTSKPYGMTLLRYRN